MVVVIIAAGVASCALDQPFIDLAKSVGAFGTTSSTVTYGYNLPVDCCSDFLRRKTRNASWRSKPVVDPGHNIAINGRGNPVNRGRSGRGMSCQ